MYLDYNRYDPRPKTLAECFKRGGIGVDFQKYHAYTAYQSERTRNRISALVTAETYKNIDTYDDEQHSSKQPSAKRSRTRRALLARRSEGGELEIIRPQQSLWWLLYVDNVLIAENKYYLDKFRGRFRLPYQQYLELVEACKESDHFKRWHGNNPKNKRCSPIQLLVLGALRYLGRGWTFDDVEESTAISQEVHRIFFHKFIEFGSTVLFERWVNAPMNFEEAKRHMGEFSEAVSPSHSVLTN